MDQSDGLHIYMFIHCKPSQNNFLIEGTDAQMFVLKLLAVMFTDAVQMTSMPI